MANARLFIVGSGALGCEFIKHFALLGCATGKDKENGKIIITDDDRIETSNISRQFLFHYKHVGMSKSKVAADSCMYINPNVNIKALELRVGEESEEYFNESFWSKLTIVVNALDNIKARQYVDGRCVWYEKPLLESGTLGTLGNVQVIVPHLTQSYAESQDPPETSIPLCTLKHFPYQVEHTIEWARDVFEGLFTQIPHDYKKILTNANLQDITLERLETLKRLLQTNASNMKAELIQISLILLNRIFVNDIQQLLYSFPPNHLNSDGQVFWSPPKRTPSPLKISLTDDFVLLFVQACSRIFASVLNVDNMSVTKSDLEDLGQLNLPEFKPEILKMISQDNVEIIKPVSVDSRINELIEQIRNIQSTVQLQPVEFEKDDDTNYHIEFIWASSVLRCRNYNITPCDRMKAKLISGKIIPAIATTTAMVGGLAAMEFVKLICFKQLKIEHFRNSFCCLAKPIWLQSEPMPPKQTKDVEYDPIVQGPMRALPNGFTVWNKLIVIIPNGTVKQLIDWIKCRFNISVVLLSAGNTCIYNSYIPSHESQRLNQPIHKLLETLQKKPLAKHVTHLAIEASCSDEDGTDVVIPTIKFDFC